MTYVFEFKNRPQTIPRDISSIRVVEAMARYNKLLDQSTALYEGDGLIPHANKDSPYINSENAALTFYLTNAVAANVHRIHDASQPLGDLSHFLHTYHRVLTSQAVRLFYYLLFITTRETRHVYDSSSFYQGLSQKWSPSWIKSIRNEGSDSVVKKLREEPSEFTLGGLCEHNCYVFEHGNFSSSYGGKPWLNVATCLLEFVQGKISAETMVDTAYTLAHNTGPIFNKGMLFHVQNTSRLHYILDVQRAGFIPQLCLHDESLLPVPEVLKAYAERARNAMPDLDGKVDWQAVAKIGVSNYSHILKKAKAAEPPPVPTPVFVVGKDKFPIIARVAMTKGAGKTKKKTAKSSESVKYKVSISVDI